MAVASIPAPTAMPMLAITKMVAALVMPSTAPRSRITTPAPMKPMPGIICAAMRVWSPPTVAGHFVGNDGEERGAEADQHVGANAGGLAAQLAFQADQTAQECGQQRAATECKSLDREAWHPRALRPAILLEGARSEAMFFECEPVLACKTSELQLRYSLNEVSFENRRARAWISLRLSVVRRSTPNFSTAKLPSTEP